SGESARPANSRPITTSKPGHAVGRTLEPVSAPRDEDVGLFGPESVSGRLHAEPILWLSAFRALLLQMMVPRAIAGVLQNSRFREDPWGRLWRTAVFCGSVIYGPTAKAEAAG